MKRLIPFAACMLFSLCAMSQDYSQSVRNIYTPPEEDGVHLLKPGESLIQDFVLPDPGIPVRTTLRVAGNVMVPEPFSRRGEEMLRRYETILDDNLDGTMHWKDGYSLFFKGGGESFSRMAWNRIRAEELGSGRITVSIPVVSSEGLTVHEGGSFGVGLEVYFRKAGRHELDIFDEPDSTIFIPVPQGSFRRKMVIQDVTLPEHAACVLLSVGGRLFSGECHIESPTFSRGRSVLWHKPFRMRKADEAGFSYKDIDYLSEETDYWVSANMSERSWPLWRIMFNGEVIKEGKIFDRSSPVADFYVTLPEDASKGGVLTLTLVDEPHRVTFPYGLRHIDIISEPAREFEVISVPEYVSSGSSFGILIETNAPDMTVSAEASEALAPQQQTVTFHDSGLHVLQFRALSSAVEPSVTITCGQRTEDCTISQIVEKGRDGIYLSVGDDIYIDKNYGDYSRYFKWYLSSRAGNWLQFRPSYQWSGVRDIDVTLVQRFTSLLEQLNMPYAWQVEGRTFAGDNINPTAAQLESPMFRGKQAHENDGGYYYWNHFRYQGLQSDIAAKRRPYGGIFAKKRPIFTPHGAYVHYDTQKVADMADGAAYFVDNLRSSKGESIRHTGPSTLFRYFYQAGYDWVGAEQMYGPEETVMSSLRGASRAYSKPVFGSLHAMQWNNGPYTGRHHPLVHYMSLAVGYMHGSSHINTEDALWTDEYLNDRYTEAGKAHMKSQNAILDFIETHTRRGQLHTGIGLVQGRNDSWKCFGRGSSWSQEGVKWAFGDAQRSFDLVKIFYPNNEMSFCDKEHLFTSSPYGPVDLFPVEAPLEQMNSYGLIAFLGWNTYNRQDFERLERYVFSGGTLLLTAAHVNACLQPDAVPVFPEDDAPVRRMLGDDYRSLEGKVTLPYGNGRVIYFADPLFPGSEQLYDEYGETLRCEAARVISGEEESGWIDCGDGAVDFTVWDDGGRRTVYLLDSDWKNPEKAASCRLLFGSSSYPVEVRSGTIATIHCACGLALIPHGQTTDILSMEKDADGWTVTVQTTGDDTVNFFRKDSELSGTFSVGGAGIHSVRVPE